MITFLTLSFSSRGSPLFPGKLCKFFLLKLLFCVDLLHVSKIFIVLPPTQNILDYSFKIFFNILKLCQKREIPQNSYTLIDLRPPEILISWQLNKHFHGLSFLTKLTTQKLLTRWFSTSRGRVPYENKLFKLNTIFFDNK